MRVEHLYIFVAITGDALSDREPLKACSALAGRSRAKTSKITICYSDGVILTIDGDPQVGAKHPVGAYLITHADKGAILWPGNAPAIGTIVTYMRKQMGDDLKKLEKLCVLSCSAAPSLSTAKLKKAQVRTIDDLDSETLAKERLDLLRLLLVLKDQGSKPIVAGYDCFVSVAFGGDGFDRPKELQEGQKFIQVDNKQPYRGTKKKRADHKKFLRIDNGVIRFETFRGWSDHDH